MTIWTEARFSTVDRGLLSTWLVGVERSFNLVIWVGAFFQPQLDQCILSTWLFYSRPSFNLQQRDLQRLQSGVECFWFCLCGWLCYAPILQPGTSIREFHAKHDCVWLVAWVAHGHGSRYVWKQRSNIKWLYMCCKPVYTSWVPCVSDRVGGCVLLIFSDPAQTTKIPHTGIVVGWLYVWPMDL